MAYSSGIPYFSRKNVRGNHLGGLCTPLMSSRSSRADQDSNDGTADPASSA
jgi:hypothetical protein